MHGASSHTMAGYAATAVDKLGQLAADGGFYRLRRPILGRAAKLLEESLLSEEGKFLVRFSAYDLYSSS